MEALFEKISKKFYFSLIEPESISYSLFWILTYYCALKVYSYFWRVTKAKDEVF